ncbi:MAG TPA: hypothetical protein VGE52_14505 [Pirellulales bacterium]
MECRWKLRPENCRPEQLAEVVRDLLDEEGDPDERAEWLDLLAACSAHPAPADLLHWPAEVPGFERESPTPEEVVAFLLDYRPPRLAPREIVSHLATLLASPNALGREQREETQRRLAAHLRGVDLPRLCEWARKRDLTAERVVELIETREIHSFPEFPWPGGPLDDDSAA